MTDLLEVIVDLLHDGKPLTSLEGPPPGTGDLIRMGRGSGQQRRLFFLRVVNVEHVYDNNVHIRTWASVEFEEYEGAHGREEWDLA